MAAGGEDRRIAGGQIFFGRRSSEGDCGLNVLGRQARKIRKYLFRGIPFGQTRKHGTEGNARPVEDGLTVADLPRADNASI